MTPQPPKTALGILRERAWQVEQQIARNDYIGAATTVSDVERDVHELALILIGLLDELADD